AGGEAQGRQASLAGERGRSRVVGFLRRREPLHERLAREGGMNPAEPSLDPRTPWQETGAHGLQRPRAWGSTRAVDAPDGEGDSARFAALPGGTLLVEEGPDGSLEALAAAVEESVRAPCRAQAARQDGSLWAVQARRIELIELPDAPGGDSLDLT